jgi:hypothetical protein
MSDPWYWKYRNKRDNAGKHGILFLLTIEEYKQLATDAGIIVTDIGRISGKYQLARINDTGPYKIGNCRFITQVENLQEVKISQKKIDHCRSIGSKPKTENQLRHSRELATSNNFRRKHAAAM